MKPVEYRELNAINQTEHYIEKKILKLYMPLRITTYDIENDYCYRESLNELLELGKYGIVDYVDEIYKAIERDNLPEEKNRPWYNT